jgi:ribosomal protein L11 methyltransferase
MTQHWHEMTVEVSRDEAESWADAFLEAGALSVQAEDADADSPDEQPLFGEPATPSSSTPSSSTPASGAHPAEPSLPFGWQRTRLAVLLADEAVPQALLDQVAISLGRQAPAIEGIKRIEDQDWVRTTQAQFDPIPVGERLLVVPSWHLDQALARADERIALIIDPGLAFGTGSHPTTHMCLEWLEQAELSGKRVIDYGCGSGILAIAAARLGGSPVIGIDIDPQALVSARENARGNRVDIHIQSSADELPAPADVVVANILSNPLKLLAPMLSALVAPGGAIVLSGVLERQIAEVAAFYEAGLAVKPWRIRDGWACLVGRRSD